MKHFATSFIALFLIISFSEAQIRYYGLTGHDITRLAISCPDTYPEPFILAGDDTTGIYYHSLEDSQPRWETFAGLDYRSVSALYIQQQGIGPAENYAVFAGLKSDTLIIDSVQHADSSLVLKVTPILSYWARADSGLRNDEVGYVTDFTGFGYSGHEPPMPLLGCADNPYIYRYQADVWQKAWTGDDNISMQTLTKSDRYLWAGGVFSSAVPTLVILISQDYGQTWELVHNGFAPVHQCNDLAVVESVTDTAFSNAVLYAAISGGVIKSSDGGASWQYTKLKNEKLNVNALAVNPLNNQHILAGGGDDENLFILYESFNGGKSWEQVPLPPRIPIPPIPQTGPITSMAGAVKNDRFVAFMGTKGGGVLRYAYPVMSIDPDGNPEIAGDFKLYQNHPNPFNPTTTIEFTLNRPGKATIEIYDITGKAIETLVDAHKTAGRHHITFDGSHLSSGVYLYRLTTEQGRSKMRKMILMK
ncbi:MAG: T9SS type A sorting domain-containing protein [Caldithrix sp.]|nr:T9SS type A sorting domain-containing protein [Caldithrix sp.]